MSRNSRAGDTHTLEHRLALPTHPMAVSGMDEERRQQTRTHKSGLLEDARRVSWLWDNPPLSSADIPGWHTRR